MGLGVQDPVTAAKILSAGSRAGFEEIAFKLREPQAPFSSGEWYRPDVLEEGLFVRDDRDWNTFEGSQDAFSQRRTRGILIQIDMIDPGDLL